MENRSKKGRWLIALVSCLLLTILGGVISLDYMLNTSDHKNNIVQALKKNYKFSFEINGPVSTRWLPRPSVVMRNVSLVLDDQEVVNARQVVVPLSLGYILPFLFKSSVSDVIVDGGLINVDYLPRLLSAETIDSDKMMFNQIIMSKFFLYSEKFPQMRKYAFSKAIIKNQRAGGVYVQGLVNYKGMLTDIQMQLGKGNAKEQAEEAGYTVKMVAKIPGASLHLDGQVRDFHAFYPLKLDTMLRFDDLEAFNKYLSRVMNEKGNVDSFDKYYQKSPLANNNITISSIVELDKQGNGTISKLTSTGPIKNLLGEIVIGNDGKKKRVSGYISIDEVDITAIQRSSKIKKNIWQAFIGVVDNIAKKFLFKPFKNLEAVLNVDIKETVYPEGRIDMIEVRLGNVNQVSLCNSFDIRVGGKSRINLRTMIENRNDTPKLNGLLLLETDKGGVFLDSIFRRDYKITKASDKSNKAENDKGGKTEKTGKVDGSVKIKDKAAPAIVVPPPPAALQKASSPGVQQEGIPGKTQKVKQDTKSVVAELPDLFESQLVIKADLFIAPGRAAVLSRGRLDNMSFVTKTLVNNVASRKVFDNDVMFDSIDFDRLNVSGIVDRFLLISYLADPDQSADLYFNLTNNYDFLRSIKSLWNVRMKAGSAVFKGEKLNNFRAIAMLETGNMEIDSKIDAKSAKGDMKLQLKLNGFRPSFVVDAKMDRLDMTKVIQNFPSNRDFLEAGSRDPYLSKFLYLHKNLTSTINRFSSNHFNADINLTAKELKISDKIKVNDSSIEASLNGGIFNLKKCEGEIFEGGKMDLRLRLLLYELMPSIYMVFNISSFNPHDLLQLLSGVNKMSGYASIGGNITTSGDTIEKIKQNISGNITFIGKNIIWEGMDISRAVGAIDSKHKFKKKLTIINQALSKGESFFDDMSAEVNITSGVVSVTNGQFSNNRVGGTFAFNYSIPHSTVNAIATYYFILMNDYITRSFSIRGSGGIKRYKVKYEAEDVINFMRNTSREENDENKTDGSVNTLRHQIYN